MPADDGGGGGGGGGGSDDGGGGGGGGGDDGGGGGGGGGDGGGGDGGGDDGGGGGTIDAGSPGDMDGGGAPDAGGGGGGEVDAGAPDAGHPQLDGEYLLGLAADLFPNSPVRFITTMDFSPNESPTSDFGTAILIFQPISAANCAPSEMGGGMPVGQPFTTAQFPINRIDQTDGTFELTFELTLANVTLPAQANTILCSQLTADTIAVSGNIVLSDDQQRADHFCGDVTVTGGSLVLPGSFGAIPIEAGTVGDANLPSPLTACPLP